MNMQSMRNAGAMTKPAMILLFLALVFVPAGCRTHGLEMTEPAEGAVVSLIRQDWKELMAERAEQPALRDDLGVPLPVHIAWNNPESLYCIVCVAEDAGMKNIVAQLPPSISSEADVCNLQTGRTYYIQLSSFREGEEPELSDVRSFSTKADEPRLILVPGKIPHNMRDLGGHRLPDGRRIRQGMVYRGSQLNEGSISIKPDGISFMLNELHIKTDLDLRYESQT